MSKKDSRSIKLSKDKRDKIIGKIKKYFADERDEELGDLGASILLDFIEEEVAVEFYNQGIYDAYTYINEKTEDLLGLQK